jgi:hypothetical protein
MRGRRLSQRMSDDSGNRQNPHLGWPDDSHHSQKDDRHHSQKDHHHHNQKDHHHNVSSKESGSTIGSGMLCDHHRQQNHTQD